MKALMEENRIAKLEAIIFLRIIRHRAMEVKPISPSKVAGRIV